jgi:hypothetical protein
MKQTQKIPVSAPEFYLIGIASHENDYRLAWAINSLLKISLVKSEDAVIFHDKYKHNINISVFSHELTDQGYSLKLFANRGDNFFLLEDLKNFDYFIKIEGEIAEKKVQAFVSELKKIDIIMGVFALDIKNIKKAQRLNF